MSTTLRAQHPDRPRAVIALGASAGSLESVGRILAGLPHTFPATILIVLHLAPQRRSRIVLLLQRRTKLRVRMARPAISPKAGTVYVAPRDNHLEIRAGKLSLSRATRANDSRPSIDRLFTSVATECGPKGIVAVLSGTGSDGAAGMVAVKARGGVALAEEVATATHTAMPAAALRTGILDAVLPVDQIPGFLLRAVDLGVPVSEAEWTKMMGLVKARTGATFAGYRSSTLRRRLQYRIAATDCPTMAAYIQRLKADVAEVDRLQAAFLIKVSYFFRDPESWTTLADEVTRLTSQRTRELRAWSAGCATGEEAYTMALLLARVLGSGPSAQWKVFATDLDDGALKAARRARYTDEQLVRVAKRDLARYFVRDGGSWRVGKVLRSRVVFGKHDLLKDPPLVDIDVLACRNVLIYFAPDERMRIVRTLSSAVNPGGLFFLGRTEALVPVPGYRRVGETTVFRRPTTIALKSRGAATSSSGAPHLAAAALGSLVEDSASIVAVAVNEHDLVVFWNRAAEDFFGKVAQQAMGRRLVKVVGSKVARQLQATMEGEPGQQIARIEGGGPKDPRELLLECMPASRPAAAIFMGISRPLPEAPASRFRPPLVSVRPRATDEARFLAHQDLADQLQGRSEELETMNEEMRGLNDELTATEADMRALASKSQAENDFLRQVINKASRPFIACDSENRVVFWNSSAVKRFGLSAEQAIGKDLFALVPALDRARMRAASRKARRSEGTGARSAVTMGGIRYLFDSMEEKPGTPPSYLLRVGELATGTGRRSGRTGPGEVRP